MNPKKILVISHDASQTGAPVLLLSLMELLKARGYVFHTVIKNHFGTLDTRFALISESCTFYNSPRKGGFWGSARQRGAKERAKRRISNLVGDVDLVLSNTITNGDILEELRDVLNVPVISYIHEMKMGAEYFTRQKYIRSVVDLTSHYFVPSNAVKTFLQQNYNIEENKISLINSFIPIKNPVSESEVQVFKRTNGFESSFVVGGMGTTDWRKSPDLFIQVAAIVFRMQPDAGIRFVWKGAVPEGLEFKRLSYDIERSGLMNKVILLPHTPEVELFYQSIDVFLLTSREDPFPLVVLEAAGYSIPSICFADAGGAKEFTQGEAGTAVEYLDLYSMASQVLKYYNDNTLVQMHGAGAFEKVRKLHQDKERIYTQVENTFKQMDHKATGALMSLSS